MSLLVLIICIAAGAAAVGILVTQASNELVIGFLVAVVMALFAIIGLRESIYAWEQNGQVDLAAERCYATVTSDPDWQGMSNEALFASATEATGTVGLTERQQVVARDICFNALQREASPAG